MVFICIYACTYISFFALNAYVYMYNHAKKQPPIYGGCGSISVASSSTSASVEQQQQQQQRRLSRYLLEFEELRVLGTWIRSYTWIDWLTTHHCTKTKSGL